MKKNKAFLMICLLCWGIITGWAENVCPVVVLSPNNEDCECVQISRDTKDGDVIGHSLDLQDIDGKSTQISYLCYLSLGLVLQFLIFYFYKNRIRLQTELEYERKHLEEVEKLNQYRMRFFTNVSHEFRTPLSIIVGQVEQLLQVRSFSPSINNRILNIYKSGTQLQSLIDELLDFQKQEQGYMKIEVGHYDMVAFVKESIPVFKEYAQKNEVQLQFVTLEEAIDVWFDRKQMQKVINNLLSNAIKYTPKGGVVTLTINKDIEKVVVSVEDAGNGIKPEDLVHIFDSFYQSKDAIGGTGIGLALAKGIVELHGGTIRVESKEGEGAMFTFCLPLGSTHYRQEEIVDEEQPILIEQMDGSLWNDMAMMQDSRIIERKGNTFGFKLLIVEDNDGLRTMLVDIFTPFYVVGQASNGQEGWDKIAEFQPDLILSDVLMPLMSGMELCRRVKTDVATSHIPVVLLTARTAVENELEGLKFGADDYITKPFNVNILLARCRNLINLRLAIQEQFTGEPQITTQLALSPLDQEFMDKAKSVVMENLSNPEFNISIFVQEMRISRTLLFNKLKAVTGQSPNDYITTIRLKEAANLLKKHPEWNVTEISEKTGFNSVGYFSRVFKERYKKTPSDYRNEEKVKEN